MNEAELVDVALGILIEVQSTVSLLPLSSSRAETGLGLGPGNKRDAVSTGTLVCQPLPPPGLGQLFSQPLPLRGSPGDELWGWTPGRVWVREESTPSVWGDPVPGSMRRDAGVYLFVFAEGSRLGEVAS